MFSYVCGIGRVGRSHRCLKGMRALLKGTAAMPPIMLVALVAWSMICGLAVQAQDDFDFFYFVQQWPGSYCDTRRGCCFPLSSNPKAVFGIHGLWPNYDDGSWPDFCTKEPFNPKELADVVDQMDDDWGSLACPASDSHSFWTHEWTKHGTCSGLGQHGYFSLPSTCTGNMISRAPLQKKEYCQTVNTIKLMRFAAQLALYSMAIYQELTATRTVMVTDNCTKCTFVLARMERLWLNAPSFLAMNARALWSFQYLILTITDLTQAVRTTLE